MKSSRLLATSLAVSLAPTSILAVLTPPPTVPFTQATAVAAASSGFGSVNTVGPTSADASAHDISNAGESFSGSAHANASFFLSSVSDSADAYKIHTSLPHLPLQPGVAKASYELSWSNGTASGDIFDKANVFPVGRRLTAFPFTYGTEYILTSLLTGRADAVIIGRGEAESSSTWADTFKFLGQPDGTPGSATFAIDFSGLSGGTATDSDASSQVSASAALRVGNLPSGTWIETGSGTAIPGLPDKGSTLLLSCAALTVLAAQRRLTGSHAHR